MKKVILFLSLILTACTAGQKQSNYYFIKGLNEYQKNNKNEALSYYEKALALDKDNSEIIREIAYLYAELGDIEAAKINYKKALELNSRDKNALENILKIFYMEENIQEIEKYSEQILDKNSLLYKHSQAKLKKLKNKK